MVKRISITRTVSTVFNNKTPSNAVVTLLPGMSALCAAMQPQLIGGSTAPGDLTALTALPGIGLARYVQDGGWYDPVAMMVKSLNVQTLAGAYYVNQSASSVGGYWLPNLVEPKSASYAANALAPQFSNGITATSPVGDQLIFPSSTLVSNAGISQQSSKRLVSRIDPGTWSYGQIEDLTPLIGGTPLAYIDVSPSFNGQTPIGPALGGIHTRSAEWIPSGTIGYDGGYFYLVLCQILNLVVVIPDNVADLALWSMPGYSTPTIADLGTVLSLFVAQSPRASLLMEAANWSAEDSHASAAFEPQNNPAAPRIITTQPVGLATPAYYSIGLTVSDNLHQSATLPNPFIGNPEYFAGLGWFTL